MEYFSDRKLLSIYMFGFSLSQPDLLTTTIHARQLENGLRKLFSILADTLRYPRVAAGGTA